MSDDDRQKILNEPLKDGGAMSAQHAAFLDMVIGLIEEGKIDLYKPASLINYEVYNNLDEQRQGKVDIEAVNLLSVLREIKDLNDLGDRETYQMSNLVERLKATKERLENAGGDLFII